MTESVTVLCKFIIQSCYCKADMLMGMSHNTKESGARNVQWDAV